jgi:hypothetical protein
VYVNTQVFVYEAWNLTSYTQVTQRTLIVLISLIQSLTAEWSCGTITFKAARCAGNYIALHRLLRGIPARGEVMLCFRECKLQIVTVIFVLIKSYQVFLRYLV